MTYTDDFSHFNVVYLIKIKSEDFDKFDDELIRYEAMATAMFGTKISKVRSDNGGEYLSTAQMNY